ncbi:cation:proton antiporter [Clostridium sp.]|uniref:cation:proton antiporter n=1 Tax=Clostridium sp. TaxID=1506 RepID=UPI003463F3D8
MENALSYDSLLILSLFAFVTPFFVKGLKKIKIPYQVGEIFVGILIGKSGLNLISSDVWIIFLSELGLAYLIFLSGLEIDFSNTMKKDSSDSKKNNQGIIITIMFLLSVMISYLLIGTLNILGLENGKLFFTLLFTAAAPGLMVPYLKSKEILNTAFGQSLLIFSLICEFVCLIGLSIIASTNKYGFSYRSFLFILLFVAAFLIYIISKKFHNRFTLWAMHFKNLHIGVRAAFALMLILVTISHKIGSEIILGSFLAGVIFSLLSGKAKEELTHKLDIIGYGFLIPIFFIMVGVDLDLKVVFNNPYALTKIPFIILTFLLVKLIPSILLKSAFGLKKSLAGGFILSAQLSLIVVGSQMALDLGFIDEATYGAFVLSTVVSCVIFPIVFEYILKDEILNDNSNKKSIDKLIIREAMVLNDNYINKKLKDIKLPRECRIFLIERNEEEILPDGETILLNGDMILLAGISPNVEEVVDVLTLEEIHS